ncbi:unnamed protein product [Alopecurus aequalis]
MEKSFRTAVLVPLLLLVCFTSPAQCRIMEGVEKENKVNLPKVLCAHRTVPPIIGKVMICCLNTGNCFLKREDCEDDCGPDTKRQSSLDTAARAPPPSRLI